MTDAVRCRRCRRVLSDPGWVPIGLGRTCAARLGLVRARKPRPVRPVRVGNPMQPSLLDGLDNDEINEE